MSKLLTHFQRHRQHMAFVVDELGAITGIVTLEDALEEIVGKIEDEFDDEQPDIVADDQGNYVVKGTMTLSVLNAKLKLNLISKELDTLSGFLIQNLGRFLNVGDIVELGRVKAENLELNGRRASKIRLLTQQKEKEENINGRKENG